MIHGTKEAEIISAFQEIHMATTIPNRLRALGNKHLSGFTKEELMERFIMEGYNPDKARRRYVQVIASKEIIPADNDSFITVYSPMHVKMHPELKEIRIRAVKVERDGTLTYLS